MVSLVWLEFPICLRVSVDSVVAVPLTSCCFPAWGCFSPSPNPQPGGPGVAFSLSSPL